MRWMLSLLLCAGCTCVGDPAELRFPCASSEECVAPYSCVAGICQLSGASPELCNNGVDDDGDGAADCADSDCAAGCDGGVQDAGAQDAGVEDAGVAPDGGPLHETLCGDLVDNDGDMLTDCADPDCALRRCAGFGVRVCCATACVNVAQDSENCGGCGVRCAPGANCLIYGGTTGVCTCGPALSCPSSQNCLNAICTCSSQTMCAAGQLCDTSLGGSGGACKYP